LVRAGFGDSAEKIPSAPCVFSQAKRGWVHSGRRGELAEERRRPDELGAAVPSRDGTLRGRAIRGRHHVALIVGPGHAEWKASRLYGAPDPSARVLLPEHDPLVLLVGCKLGVERLNQLLQRAVDDRRVVRQAGITHTGPSTENPFSAKAASVPSPLSGCRGTRTELFVCLGQIGVEGLVSFVISAVNSWNSCQGSRVDT